MSSTFADVKLYSIRRQAPVTSHTCTCLVQSHTSHNSHAKSRRRYKETGTRPNSSIVNEDEDGKATPVYECVYHSGGVCLNGYWLENTLHSLFGLWFRGLAWRTTDVRLTTDCCFQFTTGFRVKLSVVVCWIHEQVDACLAPFTFYAFSLSGWRSVAHSLLW